MTDGISRFISKTSSGGTRFGSHFLQDWHTCPTLWFNRHKRPHPTLGGEGCVTTRTASPLLVGSGFHDGIEGYYRSGWKDGKYNIEAGLSVARESFLGRKSEFTSEDIYERDWLMVERLLRKYHDHYGPEGTNCEFPEIRIEADGEGNPILEREYELDLGYRDYIYTCKVDAVVRQNDQYLNILEHKTTSASYLGRLMDSMVMSAQATGEYSILRELFPNEPINGVLINAIVKDRSAVALKRGEPEFERRLFGRTPLDIQKFKMDVVDTLMDIEEAMEEYYARSFRGELVDEAARAAFRHHRHNCIQFRRCVYLPACSAVGKESTMFRSGFRPRNIAPYNPEEENG